ncbi:MAG: ATP-dependent helicase UvrD/PcrA [Actinomycetota bacterium]|jgi:DNA helicase-2/ATP-dependent DNA helicase PcrA
MSDTFVPTDEQRGVIEHAADSSMLVIAGAGSGKTESIARRIEHLVRVGVDPSEIVALTFTNKAAAELARRVRGRLGADTDVLVSTYHGFAASLVEDHLLELDLPPRTRLINRGQAWQLCLSEFDSYHFEERSSFFPASVITDALALAARIDDFLVDVATVVADCKATLGSKATRQQIHKTARSRTELCQVVEKYAATKKRLGLLDFGDQIRLAVELVQQHPDIAASIAGQRKYALLDEYQDTNYAQRVLLTSIYRHGGVVSAVGDDMQSIYAFRGAHVRNIVEFADHFAPTKLRSLTLNRRSGSNIVAFANRIQGLVAGALDKTLTAPADAAPDGIECFLAASEVEEANQIANDVDSAVRSGRTAWSECAVLCRTRSLIGPITSALERRKIPVEVVGIGGLLERPEIVDLLAWLELLADRTRNVPLVRLLRGPVFRIGDRDLAALARHARGLIDETIVAGDRPAMVLADAVRDRLKVDGLSHAAVVRLDDLVAVWDDLCAAAERVPLAELCDEIARRTDLWAVCDDTARENLLRFSDLAQRYAPIEGAGGLGEFVEYIAMVMESEEELGEATPGDVDAVKVMTVHQAKGLEFDEVWVPGLANKKFPSPSRGGDNPESSAAALPWWVRENTEGLPHWSEVSSGQAMTDIVRKRNLDEERRLFYVACTRARKRLVLSAAQWYSGPATPQGPSEFYDFAAAQTDLVAERYRHDATDRDPRVVAMETYQREAAAAVPPPPVLPTKRGRRASAEPAELPMSLFDVSAAPVATPPRAPLGLSVSSLVSFARCPRQFHWSTVRPLPRRASTAATVGTIVHRWIETRHGPQGVLLDTDYAESQGVVAGLQQSFAASPYSDRVPAAVEAPFELLVGGHVIRGRVDAVYAHGDTEIELVDFKTGRTPADGDPSSQTQLLVYAVAAVDAWGHKPETLRASFVYLHSDGTPATAVDVPLSPEIVDAARAGLVQAITRIDGNDAATNPGAWCARCDYAAVCPASGVS